MTISNKAIEAALAGYDPCEPIRDNRVLMDSWHEQQGHPQHTHKVKLRAALEAAEPFITAELRAEINVWLTDRHTQTLAMISLRAALKED